MLPSRTVRFVFAALLVLVLPDWAVAQGARPSDIRYELRFDARTARSRTVRVDMHFTVAAPGPVLLSLPAWTPGAYEISNFARNVHGFEAAQGDRPIRWDKTDPDTWRVRPERAGPVRVGFTFVADTLDNAMAWTRPDFLLLNGTNVFLYPEGIGLDFPATVTVHTEPGWRVATGMTPAGDRFREAGYHDLVDMPMFVGRFDLDSVMVDGRAYPVASYPAGRFDGPMRQTLLAQIAAMVPPMVRVFGETPWNRYVTLLVFDESLGGGSALEHQNSHVGIYHPGFMGTPILASITAHEIFHAWNVKRLRPADLVPYRYDAPQPTTWLWMSEGITDYYADLALVRGGIVDSADFLALLDDKLTDTDATPPVALEDASLSTWVHPTDGTGYVYYPKGALAGFLLDILIRDASDNQRSLDDVLRVLYQRTWKQGRGFTGDDWWGAVTEMAGGRSFAEFNDRYIDGREPFPWDEVLPLAGLTLVTEAVREPRVGIVTSTDSANGSLVLDVVAGSSADEAGLRVGDFLLRAGDVPADQQIWGFLFRARYGEEPEGTVIRYVVRRDGVERTLEGPLRFEGRTVRRFEPVPDATPRAARIRAGLFTGR